MNCVHEEYGIWDYDEDCKKFLKVLEKFDHKYAVDFTVDVDDGSYNPPSGKYVQFRSDNFYLCADDLRKFWMLMNE